MTEHKMKMILASQALGRLACSRNDRPYIIPVTYAYDGEYIYCQSNEGLKLQIMRQNPSVCFEVDVMAGMRNWESVIINGKFEELSGEDAVYAREVLFGKVYNLSTCSTVHLHEHQEASEIDDSERVKKVMYRVRISSMTGRSGRE